MVANADGSGNHPIAERKQPEYFLPCPSAPAWSPDGKAIACAVRSVKKITARAWSAWAWKMGRK